MRSAEFWEPAIAAFEEQDAKHPPSPGAIVFTGSSSIRMWKSLGADGEPRPELFIADGLHMSAEGYALWTTILKPVLLAGS